MRYLTFALTKGRLASKTMDMLEKIGITCEEMKDPDSEIPEPVTPESQFMPATVEQLHKISEFVDAYAEMCKGTTSSDVMGSLKKKYNFSKTSEISAELADKLIEQVEFWYKKKKEADA